MVSLDKKAVLEAIRAAEAGTSGEIRVHMKRGATKDASKEAPSTFLKLGMHRTKLRNGVLIFVSEKSRQFAIVGDKGIHQRVGASFWEAVRDRMLSYFAKDELQQGIVEGVRSAGEQLKKHFPLEKNDKNELRDEVTTS